jgi:hypothetical protein
MTWPIDTDHNDADSELVTHDTTQALTHKALPTHCHTRDFHLSYKLIQIFSYIRNKKI